MERTSEYPGRSACCALKGVTIIASAEVILLNIERKYRAQPELLDKILYKDNHNVAFKSCGQCICKKPWNDYVYSA